MEDETCSVHIKVFAGLKSNLYTFVIEDNHESKKVKSIKKIVVNDELKYEDYKNVLFNKSYMRHEMNRIRSKDCNLGLYRINKYSLPSYNDIKTHN